MATPMNTGGFSQLLSRDFNKITPDSYLDTPVEYSDLANISSMPDSYIREGQTMGLTGLRATGEGEPIDLEGFKQGNEKTIYPSKFTLAVGICQELYDDDRTGLIKKAFEELGKAAAYTREYKFWDIFNSGFVTTVRTGIDSGALFSSHTLLNGGTYSNLVAAAALSMTSLQAGLTQFAKMVKENGVPCPAKARILWVPPELRFVAEKLVKNEYNPENANNEKNYGEVTSLQFKVVDYLTSTTAWFLSADKSQHDIRFINRKPLSLKNYDVPQNEVAVFQASMRFIASFINYRGVVGCAGA
jgi:hypothetical protein